MRLYKELVGNITIIINVHTYVFHRSTALWLCFENNYIYKYPSLKSVVRDLLLSPQALHSCIKEGRSLKNKFLRL